MSTFLAFNSVWWRRAGGVIALLLLAWPAQGQYNPDWTRNFRFGGLVGFNIKADFKMSGNFPISGANPGPTGDVRANHNFDDGYVRIDNFGNAADDNGVHWTTFWGYQNASQVSGDQLLMHSTSSFDTSGFSKSGSDDSPYIGFDLAYGGCIWQWTRTRVGWEFGFGYLPISISSGSHSNSASVLQSTYSFELGGTVPPEAPYNGGSSGFGQPSIQDIATLASTNISSGSVSGSQELNVTLYALRLGPTFFWDVTPQLGLALSVGPAIGIVSGDLKFKESVLTDVSATPVQNNGRISSTEIVYGGYVNATLTWHLEQNGDLYIGAQYMPLSEATFGKGGRQAKLKMGGAVFLAGGVNWPF